jgi:hypothetical protein
MTPRFFLKVYTETLWVLSVSNCPGLGLHPCLRLEADPITPEEEVKANLLL